jgi:hypothetical protein
MKKNEKWVLVGTFGGYFSNFQTDFLIIVKN